MCLLAIFMSPLEKFLFRPSAHFRLGGLLLLSCMSCLCIFKINPLSLFPVQMIFSHPEIVFSSSLWFPLLCKSF